MKKFPITLAFSVSMLFVGCSQAQTEVNESKVEEKIEVEEVTEEVENPEGHFGKVIEAEGAVSVEEFVALMADKDSLEVKLSAIAEDVCQKKGCWMKVQTADGKLMRVRFKNYEFFVPKDLSGKQVVFEGIAFKDTTSVEDLRHYAEDAGKNKEEIAAIVEPEINTSFIADGVVIVK